MKLIIRVLTVALIMLAIGTAWIAISTEANAAANSQPVAETILKDIGTATVIAEGKSPHVVYVFFDPNCPYCQQLYENTRPWVKQGKLQLRWIPTGTLTTTSRGKAAAILQAKDPLQAFHENEASYHEGGAIEEDLVSADTEKKLAVNEELLGRTEGGYVPAMLFRARDGTAKLVAGSPRKDKLKALLGNVK